MLDPSEAGLSLPLSLPPSLSSQAIHSYLTAHEMLDPSEAGLSLPLSLPLSLSHTHTHPLSRTPSLSHTPSLTLSLTHTGDAPYPDYADCSDPGLEP